MAQETPLAQRIKCPLLNYVIISKTLIVYIRYIIDRRYIFGAPMEIMHQVHKGFWISATEDQEQKQNYANWVNKWKFNLPYYYYA